MIVVEEQISKKYAQAFINNYAHDFTPTYIARVKALATFLSKDNNLFQATLSLPSLPLEKKQEFVERLAKKLSLQPYTKKLFLVVLLHGRIDLIGRILHNIVVLYGRTQNEQQFTVSTSHELTTEEKQNIINFITQHVPAQLIVCFTVDPTLICGIRIKSDSFLLERSIAKQLRNLKQLLLRQDEL